MDKSIPCNGKGGNVVSGLNELLHLLASHHLQELSLQCGFNVADIEKERSAAILSILQHLEKHPDEPLRIRSKRLKEPQSQKFEKVGMYSHRINPPFLHPVGVKGGVVLEVPDISLYEILLLKEPDWFPSDPSHPLCWFIPGIVIRGPWTIPTDTTIVTDLPYLRFESGLTMEHGAKLYGQHRCGLRLVVSQLNGPTREGGERPTISTSIRPIARDDLTNPRNFTPLPAAVGEQGDIFFYKAKSPEIQHLLISAKGDKGPSQPAPELKYGKSGLDGMCDPGRDYRPPEDGESVGDADFSISGVPGGEGYSPAPLTIHLTNGISGVVKFLFEASGGQGGGGGDGQNGQDVRGGNGGNLPVRCFSPFTQREPGKGGSAGQPGNGGHGGRGGKGGNGGTISLRYPGGTNETLFRACVKGGDGGWGGLGGSYGTSCKGRDGSWTLMGTPLNADEPETAFGDRGQRDSSGDRGLNGKIFANGNVVVPGGDSSTVPDSYCYPPPGSDEC
jgi:hypothetical protein